MDTTNMKVRQATLKRLKLPATLQDDTMMHVLDRLVEQELARVETERAKRKAFHESDASL